MKQLIFICLFVMSCNNSTESLIDNNNNLVQVCLTLDGSNINYESFVEIKGFQFDHNGCITEASNGDASTYGFTISLSETTLLAFSLIGSTIPIGSGTLIELNNIISQTCIDNVIFSGESGTSLNVDWICAR